MLKVRTMGRSRAPARPPGPIERRNPHDQRALIHLLGFLIAGFERVSPSRAPRAAPRAVELEAWEDEEYLYLESLVPGGPSDLDIDLNLTMGRIFARIRKRDIDVGR